jgi:hypothetical protein
VTIPETSDKVITAIITPTANRAILASLEGIIYDCTFQPNGPVMVRAITPTDFPSLRIDAARPVPLTSLAFQNGALIIGTSSRGLLRIDDFLTPTGTVEIKEVVSRPRLFFVETLALDPSNLLWYGGQTTPEDSGFIRLRNFCDPRRSVSVWGRSARSLSISAESYGAPVRAGGDGRRRAGPRASDF